MSRSHGSIGYKAALVACIGLCVVCCVLLVAPKGSFLFMDMLLVNVCCVFESKWDVRMCLWSNFDACWRPKGRRGNVLSAIWERVGMQMVLFWGSIREVF